MSTLRPPSGVDRHLLAVFLVMGIACNQPNVATAVAEIEPIDTAAVFDQVLESLRCDPIALRSIEKSLAHVKASRALPGFIRLARQKVKAAPEDPKARFLLGRLLTLDGKAPSSRTELEVAVRLDASFGPAHIALARLAITEKNWSEALKAVTRAIDLGLDDSDTWLLQARMFEALDRQDEAEPAFLESFRQDPTSAIALFELAESLERLGQRRRCEKTLRQIIEKVDSRFMPAREKLIWLHLGANSMETAEEYFAQFAKLEQTGPIVERCRAYLHFRKTENSDRLEGYHADLVRIVEAYPEDVRARVDLSVTCLAAGDLEKSLEQTDAALQVDPTDLAARELKAALLKRVLRYEDAADIYRGLLRDRPRNIAWQRSLKDVALVLDDFETAIRILRSLIARDEPEEMRNLRSLFLRELLRTLVEAKRFSEAVTEAEVWMKKSPDDAFRRQAYVSILREVGRHQEAIGVARSWLSEEPTSLELRVQLVNELRAAGRYVEAQQHILDWLKDAPGDPALNRMMILILWTAGDYDGAIELARAGTEEPQHRDFYRGLLGLSYLQARRFDDAIDLNHEEIKELDEGGSYPQVVAAHQRLISALIEAERLAEAEKIAQRLLNSQLAQQEAGAPHDVALLIDMRRTLATIFQMTDRDQQAIAHLEEIYRLSPADIGVNNDLGYTWAAAGIKLEEAERMIRLALAEQPREAAYLDSMGWVRYMRGDFKRAVHYLKQAERRVDIPDPVIHDHLGDAIYRIGKKDEAKRHWEEASSLTAPDADPPPSIEQRRLREEVQKKLAQLAKGVAVDVAAVGGSHSATTRPADTQPAAGAQKAE